MTKLAANLSALPALLLALAVVGCATAATVTGHISGADFLGVLGGVGLVGGNVATAHVVGSQVNTAAGGIVPGVPPAPGGVPAGTGSSAGPAGPQAVV